MTKGKGELVERDRAPDPNPMDALHRSVDEARSEVKKRLWFTPVALVIIAVLGFLLGDWSYVAVLGGVLGLGIVRLRGELKEPQRYLTVHPNQLANRILENREFWETRGKELRDPEAVMQVQDLLDALQLEGSWFRRNTPRVAKWTGILATVMWLAFAVVMLVGEGSAWTSLVPLVAASLFGVGTVWSWRTESKRQEALALLEEVREAVGPTVPSLRA